MLPQAMYHMNGDLNVNCHFFMSATMLKNSIFKLMSKINDGVSVSIEAWLFDLIKRLHARYWRAGVCFYTSSH